MRIRLILLATATLAMGACGGNDEDINQAVGDEEIDTAYDTTTDEQMTDPVMETESTIGTSVPEDQIPTTDIEETLEEDEEMIDDAAVTPETDTASPN